MTPGLSAAIARIRAEVDRSIMLVWSTRKDAIILLSALEEAQSVRSGWQPIETAPKDGTQFLAGLSNGWVVILSESPDWERYAWYRGPSHIPAIPVARTHTPGSLSENITALCWQPLPVLTPTGAQP